MKLQLNVVFTVMTIHKKKLIDTLNKIVSFGTNILSVDFLTTEQNHATSKHKFNENLTVSMNFLFVNSHVHCIIYISMSFNNAYVQNKVR